MSKRSFYSRRVDTRYPKHLKIPQGFGVRQPYAAFLRIAMLCNLALAALFLNALAALASSSDPPLRDEWTDANTGHRVRRISRIPGESESFYFHQNAFTATGDKMVFANTPTNHSRDFFTLRLAHSQNRPINRRRN
jgi:hypothetical protein